jgi:amino acid adenylation domain-containing protein
VATEGKNGRPAIEYSSPEGIAEHLTYQQLHQRADSLAQVLRAESTFNSTTRGDQQLIVPIFIQQCPLLYISELAILKAGAAFCPLPLDIPEDRLRFIVEDVQATVLLTTTQLREELPLLNSVSVVTVDDLPFDQEVEQLQDHVDPSQTAYIMYTSGSTGKPKGVILSHSAATQALLAHERHIPDFSRFLQFASPTFDVSVFEIFFPLFRGHTLVCGDRRQLLNDLPGFINTMGVDAAELTPSVASSLLHGRDKLPSLKLLLTIGEMLKREVVEEFGGPWNKQSILYGMYGPTEAAIHCTLQPAFTSDMPTGNIGIPLDTVSAFVVKPQAENEPLSEEIEILPIGEEGELAVGGYQLADGYLNRPEQTKAAFVSHSKFGKLYRTGDRAKLTKAGSLECLGRISSGQVKLRGQVRTHIVLELRIKADVISEN